jgi:ribosome-associated protein
VTCQEARSQIKNKELVVKKIIDLLKQSIQVDKDRISTIPTKESREKRIKAKKLDGDRKTNRGNLKNKLMDQDM